MTQNQPDGLQLVVMDRICKEDTKNRGAGRNRCISIEDLFKFFPAVTSLEDREEILNTLTTNNLIERNGENIRLTRRGQDWCIGNSDGYIGSYPPAIE